MEPPKLWWKDSKPMEPLAPPESPDQKAVRLLNEQLKELESIRGLNDKDPVFKAWRERATARANGTDRKL